MLKRFRTGCKDSSWRVWPYSPGLKLKHHDHAGVGSLELQDEQRQLACWRYTPGLNIDALRLIKVFEQQREDHLAGRAAQSQVQIVCLECQASLPAGSDA